MIAIPVLAVTLVSIGVTSLLLAHSAKRPLVIPLVVGFLTGIATYCCALGAGFALSFFGLGLGVADAFTEECLKALSIRIPSRFCNAVGLTAAFATAEVVGKYYFIFLLASSERSILLQNHMNYLVLGIAGAYLMHISTGLLYSKIGLARGFVASVVLHCSYNLLGLHFDKVANTADGIVLFFIGGAFIAAASRSREFFGGSLQHEALNSHR